MVDTSAQRRADGSPTGCVAAAGHVIETDSRSLEGAGFDLSAAAADAQSPDLAVVVQPSAGRGLLAALTRRGRGSAPQRNVAAESDPVARVTALRERHRKALLVVHRARVPDAPTRTGHLVEAGADIVVTVGGAKTSITRSHGRPLVRLGSAVPGGSSGDRSERLQWSAALRRESSPSGRLSLHLTARVVSEAGSRAPTTEEMAALYADALLRTSQTQLFLELVDSWADDEAGHLVIDLAASGGFSPPTREYPEARPGWVDDPAASFTADPGLLATPRIIRYELERRGYRVDAVTSNYLLGERAGSTIGYLFSNSHRAPQTAVRAAADKGIARSILARAGVPVADGRFFADRSDIDAAEEVLRELGSVVVKPVDAGHGNGVTVGVRTRESLHAAWESAFDMTRSGVVVERHVSGVEARFMIVDDSCVSVSCARPPRIVGDGRSTVRQLINALNAMRSRNPLLASRPVLLDADRFRRMRDHGISLLTVLPEGEHYDVATDTSWYGGTTTEDITDEVHPSYKEYAVEAVRAVPGLAVAGLDVIMENYTRPASDSPFVVLEVNSQPGLGLPHFPAIGAARNPAGAIIDADLAPRRPSNFHSAPADSSYGRRPTDPHTATAAIGDELEDLGFDLDWLADDYLHAHRDDVSTAVWKSYTTLSGKSAASAAQHPRISHGLLERAGVAVPQGWKAFVRDADSARFRNGRKALEYAVTLDSPAFRVSNRDFVPVDPTDEESFRTVWDRLCRGGKRGIVAAEHPIGVVARVLVSHGTALAVHRVPGPGDTDPPLSPIDPTYLTVAVRACDAFRGLDLGEVVLHLDDPAAPATPLNHTVSSVRTSPDLRTFQSEAATTGRNIVREITVRHVEHLLQVLQTR